MGHRHQRLKKEHSILGGAKETLEALAHAPHVARVIPGRIRRGESTHRGVFFSVQYRTESGLKLLCHHGACQEVFVVTDSPADVEVWIREHLPLRDKS